MFDLSKLRVYPGHEMVHVRLSPLVANESDRKMRVTLDTGFPGTSTEEKLGDSTYMKVIGLRNETNYRVWVIYQDEKWEDFPDSYKDVLPSMRHVLPSRSNSPARDISSFFTVLFNILSANYPNVITAPHGSFVNFGELDRGSEQLTPVQIERLRVLEANLRDLMLTDLEKIEYEELKGKITTGNAPVITYRVLARQHASLGTSPFSGSMELAPKSMQAIDPVTESYATDLIWSYDNMIEIQIHSRDITEADCLCLILEYLVDDYRDMFQRSGVPFVYFDGREADEFVRDGHIERHVRTVRVYAKTQRVHRQAFPLIQEIETEISLATRSMDASVLIQNRDFA